MSDGSAIQWTDATWNPVVGCERISPGCANCYAKAIHDRRHKGFLAGANVLVPQYAQPFEAVRPRQDRLDVPLHWRKPRRVFVNSMSDLFHEDVPDAFIDRVFAVMALAPRHTFQVLTKRADRMRAYLAAGQYRDVQVADAAKVLHTTVRPFALPSEAVFDARRVAFNQPWLINAWPLPNVWLGVSVENQHFADERIPLLLQTPAAVRFISAEPLLGPVNLTILPTGTAGERLHDALSGRNTWNGRIMPKLDWVIVGGESGPKSRPFDMQWARAIIAQCQAAGVACFMKQLGAHAFEGEPENDGGGPLYGLRDKKGGDPSEWPEDLRIRDFPDVEAR